METPLKLAIWSNTLILVSFFSELHECRESFAILKKLIHSIIAYLFIDVILKSNDS
jgi:hypothetical protein